MHPRSAFPLLSFLLTLLLAGCGGDPVIDPGNIWPGFRGPDGSGLPAAAAVPESWSREQNVIWVKEIPGRGWSSPIVWGNRLFVTTAVSEGDFKEPSKGIFGNDYIAELQAQGLSLEEAAKKTFDRDLEPTSENSPPIDWLLLAFDTESGNLLWQQQIHRGQAPGGRHRKNTFASETPVTDGQRVYVLVGNVGVYAFSLQGEPLWKHPLEKRQIYLNFGTASSPAQDERRLYILNDNDEECYLKALDKTNGEELWSVTRCKAGEGEQRGFNSGWASPYVWKNELRTEIVTIGLRHAISYDQQGNELWRLGGLVGQATPSPFAAGGLLYVGTGAQGGPNRPLFAVKPGAGGDITLSEGETSNQFVSWYQQRASGYTPTALAYLGRVFSVDDRGILTVLDNSNGKVVYQARVGEGATFSASPWGGNGKIFLLSEDGNTYVLDATASEYRELAVNRLDEMTLASPAFDRDSLYLRTQTHLLRISQKK